MIHFAYATSTSSCTYNSLDPDDSDSLSGAVTVASSGNWSGSGAAVRISQSSAGKIFVAHLDSGIGVTIYNVTCKKCLIIRASKLGGWRWYHPSNEKEVNYLKLKLKKEADSYKKLTRRDMRILSGELNIYV